MGFFSAVKKFFTGGSSAEEKKEAPVDVRETAAEKPEGSNNSVPS